MDKKYEDFIFKYMIVVVLAIIILTLLSACRTKKHMESTAVSRETLTQSYQRLSAYHNIDSMFEALTFGADSIIITFDSAMAPEEQQESRRPPILRMGDQPDSLRTLSAKADNRLCKLKPYTIKIHNPHFTASSEKRIVEKSSSQDSSDTSMQSFSEEDVEQDSAPAKPTWWLIIIVIVVITTAGVLFSVLHDRR